MDHLISIKVETNCPFFIKFFKNSHSINMQHLNIIVGRDVSR